MECFYFYSKSLHKKVIFFFVIQNFLTSRKWVLRNNFQFPISVTKNFILEVEVFLEIIS